MIIKKCDRCKGEGQRYDATMADAIAGGGSGMVRCPTCRGAGVTRRLTVEEMIAEAEAHIAANPAPRRGESWRARR